MVRWSMVIDLDRCSACQACTFACLSENNQPFVGPIEAEKRRIHSWHDFIDMEIGGLKVPVPRPCMHCDVAPCVKICPTGARFYFEGGVVLQSYDRCIGCRTCMTACPYNVNYFKWLDYESEDVLKEHRNPDKVVLTGMGRVGPGQGLLGVVEKCTYCVHKIVKLRQDLRKGNAGELSNIFRETEVDWESVAKSIDLIMRYLINPSAVRLKLEGKEIWYLPACVSTCTSRARVFGDIDDPSSLVSSWARSSRSFRLLEDMGTEPKTIYLSQGW